MENQRVVLQLNPTLIEAIAVKASECKSHRSDVIRAAIQFGLEYVGLNEGQELPCSAQNRVKLDAANQFKWWLIGQKDWSKRSASSTASTIRRALKERSPDETLRSWADRGLHSKSTRYALKAALRQWEAWCRETDHDPYAL